MNQQLHDSVQGLLKMSEKKGPAGPPRAVNMANMKATGQDAADAKSQTTQVPIDEVDAIGVKVAPTFPLDTIQSVTLKNFRKVVGYDTFNSILKKDRDEQKDHSDYYNVTVSMMVKRTPKDSVKPKAI